MAENYDINELMAKAKRIIEQPETTQVYDDDYFMVDSTTNGTRKASVNVFKEALGINGAVQNAAEAKLAADTAQAAAEEAKTAAETAQSNIESAVNAVEEMQAEVSKWSDEINQNRIDTSWLQASVDEAITKAEESINVSSEAANKVTNLETIVNQIKEESAGYVDGGHLENGYLILTHGEETIGDPLGPLIISSSGGLNNAVLTVKNTSGWLSKTVSNGDSVNVSINWSSIEDELPTGAGTLKVTVNSIAKASISVNQGDVSVNISDYLDTGANSVKITISDVYDNNRTVSFSVEVVSLSITSSFDATTTYSDSIVFAYTPTGAVAKEVHFVLDGQMIATVSTSVSGRQLTYTIPKQSHGAHTLKCYFTAKLNEETVTSNILYYEFICLEAGNNTAIISSQFAKEKVDQYSTVTIPYTAYTPNAFTTAITIDVNNTTAATLTVDRTQQVFSYRADTVGENVIEISSGEVKKTITFEVTEVNVDSEAETDSLALYLTSYGRSNNESTRNEWKYNDISASLTDFDFVSNGWVQDDDSISVLRVSGKARVEIPYKIFGSDFRTTGKTIELEFATRDVMNYDSPVISCMSDNRGISLTAQKVVFRSEQSEIMTQYKEDEHVRVSFVVQKRSEQRLVYCYINGVASGCIRYATDDDFSQKTPVGISIGSDDCTVDVYNIRVYDNNLTSEQIVNNWIADTQIGSEMIQRYARNNVMDEYGNIVIAKLPSDLPYMIIEGAELPQSKGDKKTVSGSYTDPNRPSKSFTFENCQIDVQGTSSQYYARKNYKMKFKGGFHLNNGSDSETYALTAGAIPVNVFTMKADVASSEGANNVELVRLYDSACPYKTPAQQSNSAVRQGIDGYPMVIFWNDGENTTFLGKYNFNNDKSTEEVFGFEEGDESWEIRNNTSDRVVWKSADYEGDDWLNDFEARYPDTDPAYTDAAQLKEFAEWMVSVDPDKATNEALAESVTYGDVEYTTDSAEYRLAKFDAEVENYTEIESAEFYYLFTELFLMVDSRAKNAFPSFIGGAV